MTTTGICWSAEHQAFIGMVIEDETLLTVGMKPTKHEMQAWLDDAVARRAWEDGSELPDMHDRTH